MSSETGTSGPTLSEPAEPVAVAAGAYLIPAVAGPRASLLLCRPPSLLLVSAGPGPEGGPVVGGPVGDGVLDDERGRADAVWSLVGSDAVDVVLRAPLGPHQVGLVGADRSLVAAPGGTWALFDHVLELAWIDVVPDGAADDAGRGVGGLGREQAEGWSELLDLHRPRVVVGPCLPVHRGARLARLLDGLRLGRSVE